MAHSNYFTFDENYIGMNSRINDLSEQDRKDLVTAPVLVAMLIAGADLKIDKKEEEWVRKLLDYKALVGDSELRGLYEEASEDFDLHFEEMLASFRREGGIFKQEELDMLSDRLAGLNGILDKLDMSSASKVYDELKDIARSVAKSSGGTLGFGSISEEERRYMELPMLKNPA